MSRAITGGAIALALGLGGCLGPLVSDNPVEADGVLPAGTAVPSIDDDPVLAAQLAAHDNVSGVVPRISGFAAGAPAHSWDFGPAPDFAAPLFVLVKRDAGGVLQPIAHPTIAEAIPGEPGYSPYWSIFLVEVTDRYADEVLPSAYALQEAENDGLVLAPVVQPVGRNCPFVADDVRLEVGAGQPPVAAGHRAYYDGVSVGYYDFGPMPLVDSVAVPEMPRYVLRREGGEPLDEPIRHVDLTGDGDLADTNDVFARAVTDPDATPRCRTISVAVAASTRSIDTTRDETMADLRDAAQLFDPDPIAGTVVAFETTDDVRNCVQQHAAGGL